MTLYNRIKEYLESKEKDYTEGLNLFLMVSNHRSMALYLQRKKNAEKLDYELSKLLKNLPAKLQKISMPEKAIANESNDNRKSEIEGPDPIAVQGTTTNDGDGISSAATGTTGGEGGNTGVTSPAGENSTPNPEDNTGAGQTKSAEKNDEDSDHKIIEFRTVRPEDLPDEMKPLYDEIAQKHKEMRSIHEKMKLADSDEARAELRKQLVDCDELVSAGWKQIDEFLLLQNQPKVDDKKKEEITPVQPEASDVAKEISAARTYLSRNIEVYQKADEKDKRKLFEKIEKRIKILNDNKASVSKKTKKALIDLGIITKSSALLAE